MARRQFSVDDVLGQVQADEDSGDDGWPDESTSSDSDPGNDIDLYYQPPDPVQQVFPRDRGQGRRRRRGAPRRGRGRGRGVARNVAQDHVNQPPNPWVNLQGEEDYIAWITKFQGQAGYVGPQHPNPIDCFLQFATHDFWQLLIEETNRYAEQFLEMTELRPKSRFRKWEPVTVADMKAFVAIIFTMGLVEKHDIEDYWSTFWLTATPGIRQIMSRNRFELIISFLHVANNNNFIPRGQDGHDRLFKIRPLIDIVIPLFCERYKPGKELSLDEQTIAFKGRSFMKQYNPKKPSKWGYKAFVLADPKNAYILKWNLYSGKQDAPDIDDNQDAGATFNIVRDLCVDYFDEGHVVYMDNFYTSVQLAEYFITKQTGICGTLNIRRKHTPPQLKPVACPLVKGDDPAYCRNGHILICAWQDTKRVHSLSTVHGNSNVQKEIRSKHSETGFRVINKPYLIDQYNAFMGGVDVCDQRVKTYKFPHRSRKWYPRIIYQIFNMMMVNSHVIYQDIVGNKKLPLKQFQLNVCVSLLEGYATNQQAFARPVSGDKPQRLTERHFPGAVEDQHRPDCIVCSDRSVKGGRRQTRHQCKQCHRPMCVIPCFERYHTMLSYGKCHLDM